MRDKKMTIEDLAKIVNRGFTDLTIHVDGEFKRLDQSVEALRLELESRLDAIEKRLGIIETKVFDEYHERIARLEEIVYRLPHQK